MKTKIVFSTIILFSSMMIQAQWYPQPCYSNKDILSLSIVNEMYSWAAGDEGILRTHDGEYWFLTYVSPFPRAVCFVNESLGWTITANGISLMETMNGGNTWEDFTPYCDFDGCFLQDVCFVDSIHGWYTVTEVLGARDVTSLYYTDNKGFTWEWQMFCLGGLSVDFINPLIGWVNNDGDLWLTWNGGDYWDSTYAYMDRSVISAHFVDILAGWAIGVDSSIIHTYDGGHSWVEQFVANEKLYDIHFVDHKNGWAVGNNGIILCTDDGGISWETQESGTNVELYDVFFLDPHHGWVAGDDGTILHTENGGIVGQKENQPEESITELNIFPNPASSVTRLRFTTLDSRYTMIDLFAISGVKIRELLNEMQASGVHEIELDVSSLPAGVYFVRLQARTEIAMRKLIVR